MLVVTVSVNIDRIDTIMVQNVGLHEQTGLTQYKIRQPKGYDGTILHKRDTGYRPLLEKVLHCLNHKHT